jgi:hypothetical protein
VVFDADGSFSALVTSNDGSFVPRDDGRERTWVLRHQTPLGPLDQPFELEMNLGDRMESVGVVFVETPSYVRLWNGPGSTVGYLRSAPELPPTGSAATPVLAALAGLLIVVGAAMTVAARRATPRP